MKPESVVIIGDSRAWFDLDLDELQKGLGKRPVQLAAPGSCAYPVLADLANDERFHGTIICSILPRLFFAPPGSPPLERSEKTVRRSHTQTLAQRASQSLAIPLEEHVAFLKQQDLTLDELLKRPANSQSARRTCPAASSTIFPVGRSGTSRPHDRAVCPTRRIAE